MVRNYAQFASFPKSHFYFSLLILVVAFLTACVEPQRQLMERRTEIVLQSYNKFPMHASLFLNSSLLNYSDSTWEFPVGTVTARNAEALVRYLFEGVDVIKSEPVYPIVGDDVSLAPRIAFFTRQPGGKFAFSEAETNIIVEWTATDRNGVVLWQTAVNGVAKGQVGTIFSIAENARDRSERAIADFARKSVEELASSRELQQMAVASSLYYSDSQNHTNLAEEILKRRPDQTVRNGNLLLYFSAEFGHIDLAEYLLSEGVHINAGALFGRLTPLHLAAKYNQLAMAEFLIDKKAEVNSRMANLATPLHHAASVGNEDMVLLLIRKGAAIDATDQQGRAPLYYATWFNHEKVADLLLENGAEPNVRDENNPFDTAEIYRRFGSYYEKSWKKDRAVNAYRTAEDFYQRAEIRYRKLAQGEISKRGARVLASLFASALQSVSQDIQTSANRRQLAEVSALNAAIENGTGYQGYYRALRAYEPYINGRAYYSDSSESFRSGVQLYSAIDGMSSKQRQKVYEQTVENSIRARELVRKKLACLIASQSPTEMKNCPS